MNMKKLFGIIVLAMLAVCSTALVSCGDDDEDITSQNRVVTVDASGNAKGCYRFTRIDARNFLIDDIIYTLSGENLTVSGYDPIFFKGEANIIFALNYGGVTMVVNRISGAFNDCTALTSVNIPNSVTKIDDYAFAGCSGLTSINIPNSVTLIDSDAFCDCTGLTSVNIPNSVTSIGRRAFCGCTGLTSINIPNSVIKIDENAFSRCTGLTSVTIPNSVTWIGQYAFRDCSGLKDVYCYATTPPSVYINIFSETNLSSITLHVPAQSVDTYKRKSPWSGFGSIVAIE